MGKLKVVIRKIKNNNARHVTFVKRRNGLIKKAMELAVLFDTNVALILFSPGGRLICFAGNKRVEDVLIYVTIPAHLRGSGIENREQLLNSLQDLKRERELAAWITKIEELHKDVDELKKRLEVVEARLRNYKPDMVASLDQIEACESCLVDGLKRIAQMKEDFIRGIVPTEDSSSNQIYVDLQNGLLRSFDVDDHDWHGMDWMPGIDDPVVPASSELPNQASNEENGFPFDAITYPGERPYINPTNAEQAVWQKDHSLVDVRPLMCPMFSPIQVSLEMTYYPMLPNDTAGFLPSDAHE